MLLIFIGIYGVLKQGYLANLIIRIQNKIYKIKTYKYVNLIVRKKFLK